MEIFHHLRSPVVVLEANACELAIELDSAWHVTEVLYRRHVLLPVLPSFFEEEYGDMENQHLEGFYIYIRIYIYSFFFLGGGGREGVSFQKIVWKRLFFQENEQIEVEWSWISHLMWKKQWFTSISFHNVAVPHYPAKNTKSTLHRSKFSKTSITLN